MLHRALVAAPRAAAGSLRQVAAVRHRVGILGRPLPVTQCRPLSSTSPSLATPSDSHDYVLVARSIVGGAFQPEPRKTQFCKVPRGQSAPTPADAIDRAQWFDEVRDAADGVKDSRISPAGDVLVFVRGYNNDQETVMRRQRRLAADLRDAGFHGLVTSFDWPSDDSTLNYREDRSDAYATAYRLVRDCIVPMSRVAADCETQVHLLGHSTGAYVIREAFRAAEVYHDAYRARWGVSQVAFIGADISQRSAQLGGDCKALIARTGRLTNYSSEYDYVLKASNAKRLFLRPRLGRVGLPANVSPKCVNVSCGAYYASLPDDIADSPDQCEVLGTPAHSWHIGNKVWARDFALTLMGTVHRDHIETRRVGHDRGHGLVLTRPPS